MARVDSFEENGTLKISFSGKWTLTEKIENRDLLLADFQKKNWEKVIFDGKKIERWDSRLVALLVRLSAVCGKKNIPCEWIDFSAGVKGLLKLAFAIPVKKTVFIPVVHENFLYKTGMAAIETWEKIGIAYDFTRKTYAAVVRFLMRRAVVRKNDITDEIYLAGAAALPIVSLICFMVGLILAFVGSIQLKMFGAQIYVSSLVAISITRVMGAIMAGVIMAGRTGAAYAATLGSMKVNEEVDALETMGISPFDFLIMPRVLALSLMMPLLTIYADLMGILGGSFVGIVMLGLSAEDYFRMTLKALFMRNVIVGIIYGSAYGVIIALCGCYQGFSCGRNAAAVGNATTSAVVNSIVWMVVATAVLTFIFNFFGV